MLQLNMPRTWNGGRLDQQLFIEAKLRRLCIADRNVLSGSLNRNFGLIRNARHGVAAPHEEVYLKAYDSVSEARTSDRALPRLLQSPSSTFEP